LEEDRKKSLKQLEQKIREDQEKDRINKLKLEEELTKMKENHQKEMNKLFQQEKDMNDKYNYEKSKNLAEHLNRMDQIEENHLSNMYLQQQDHEYNMWNIQNKYNN
jgi:hypothetical protein